MLIHERSGRESTGSRVGTELEHCDELVPQPPIDDHTTDKYAFVVMLQNTAQVREVPSEDLSTSLEKLQVADKQ